jgi:hypothetical protein
MTESDDVSNISLLVKPRPASIIASGTMFKQEQLSKTMD